MADFWDVIDAIGSFGGMILAGIAGFVAYRLFIVESERDRKADDLLRQQAADRLRQQAASIGFWYDATRRMLCVFNASPLPIYKVMVQQPAAVTLAVTYWGKIHDAVRPGEMLEIPDSRKEAPATGAQTVRLVRAEDRAAILRFADNANNWWSRNLQGELAQIEPPFQP